MLKMKTWKRMAMMCGFVGLLVGGSVFSSCSKDDDDDSGELSDFNGEICPDENHPHAIDLGNGMIFSCCNVGATNPLECGKYVAWKELKEKDEYLCTTYSFYKVDNKTASVFSTNPPAEDDYAYDLARVDRGYPWRMPTQTEFSLLNKKAQWYKGSYGVMVTGRNGNHVFFPANGYKLEKRLIDLNEEVCYWSANSWQQFHQYGRAWMLTAMKLKKGEGLDYTEYIYWMDAYLGCGVRPMYAEWRSAVDATEPETENPGNAIDMGLPSGVKWADRNVMAKNSEDYGVKYAWGELKRKYGPSLKYYYQYYDAKTNTIKFLANDISGTNYDVAHKKWGGEWRMPTKEEFEELYKNCDIKYVKRGKNSGHLFISRINHNELFFPYIGDNPIGDYWTSTYIGKMDGLDYMVHRVMMWNDDAEGEQEVNKIMKKEFGYPADVYYECFVRPVQGK